MAEDTRQQLRDWVYSHVVETYGSDRCISSLISHNEGGAITEWPNMLFPRHAVDVQDQTVQHLTSLPASEVLYSYVFPRQNTVVVLTSMTHPYREIYLDPNLPPTFKCAVVFHDILNTVRPIGCVGQRVATRGTPHHPLAELVRSMRDRIARLEARAM